MNKILTWVVMPVIIVVLAVFLIRGIYVPVRSEQARTYRNDKVTERLNDICKEQAADTSRDSNQPNNNAENWK
ncbi:MAG: hypothetical protein LBT48_02185 [Prevotellaceae bacterium]|jgi:uncharacterized membrane protein|nr:hypothetical protein [Prevotellaceae bacterium]